MEDGMDQRLESQMRALEDIQDLLQSQLLKFVQDKKAQFEERRKSMEHRSFNFQNQPPVEAHKKKILKS